MLTACVLRWTVGPEAAAALGLDAVSSNVLTKAVLAGASDGFGMPSCQGIRLCDPGLDSD